MTSILFYRRWRKLSAVNNYVCNAIQLCNKQYQYHSNYQRGQGASLAIRMLSFLYRSVIRWCCEKLLNFYPCIYELRNQVITFEIGIVCLSNNWYLTNLVHRSKYSWYKLKAYKDMQKYNDTTNQSACELGMYIKTMTPNYVRICFKRQTSELLILMSLWALVY